MKFRKQLILLISSVLVIPFVLPACETIPEGGIDHDKKIIYLDQAFGSKPNSGEDAAPALRKALAMTEGTEGWTIKLGKGTYTMSPQSPAEADPLNRDFALGEFTNSVFFCRSQKNLKIVGNGTKFMLTDPLAGVFYFIGSENISISGITVDMEKLPWVQGTVVSTDPQSGSFILRPDEGYDILDDPRCIKIFETLGSNKHVTGNIYESAGRLKATANDHFLVDSYVKLSDGNYEFKCPASQLSDLYLAESDKIVINCRTGGGGFVLFTGGSSTLSLKDVTIYTSAGGGVMAVGNKGTLSAENFNILRKPDSGRLISTTMDGIHVQGGKAVTVKNCTFEGMMDDGINLYQAPIAVNSSSPDGKSFTTPLKNPAVEEGETLSFYDPSKGVLLGRAKVISVSTVNPALPEITLDTAVNGLSAGVSVYTDALDFDGTVISGNTFREYRGSGVITRGKNITISDNLFKDISGIGIDLQNYASSEGPWAENITVKNNTFDGISYMGCYARLGDVRLSPINIRLTKTNWTNGTDRLNTGITIDSNTFKNIDTARLISISETDGCSVVNNTIEMSASGPAGFYLNTPLAETCVIYISNAENVTVENNSITDRRERTSEVIIDRGVNNTIGSNNIER